MMREQAESIGVSFEVYQVVPLLWRDTVTSFRADVILQELPVALAEIGSDGLFSAMAERRVTKVVCKAGSADDVAKFGEVGA